MNAFVAWRMLTHEKGRNTLAVGGIFIAVLMIFLQLGFYDCVPKAGMLTYNGMRFDMAAEADCAINSDLAGFRRENIEDFADHDWSVRPRRCFAG